MFGKLKALFGVFQAGKAVANPAAWKAGQVTGTMLGGFILAAVSLAKAFGHEFPVDEAVADQIGVGVIALVNVLLTVATSKTVGLPVAAAKEFKRDVNQPDSSGVTIGNATAPRVSMEAATDAKPVAPDAKPDAGPSGPGPRDMDYRG